MTTIGIRIHAAWSMLVLRLKEEAGQDLLEYALIGGFVAAALVVGGIILGPQVSKMFTGIGYCIDFDKTTTCGPF